MAENNAHLLGILNKLGIKLDPGQRASKKDLIGIGKQLGLDLEAEAGDNGHQKTSIPSSRFEDTKSLRKPIPKYNSSNTKSYARRMIEQELERDAQRMVAEEPIKVKPKQDYRPKQEFPHSFKLNSEVVDNGFDEDSYDTSKFSNLRRSQVLKSNFMDSDGLRLNSKAADDGFDEDSYLTSKFTNTRRSQSLKSSFMDADSLPLSSEFADDGYDEDPFDAIPKFGNFRKSQALKPNLIDPESLRRKPKVANDGYEEDSYDIPKFGNIMKSQNLKPNLIDPESLRRKPKVEYDGYEEDSYDIPKFGSIRKSNSLNSNSIDPDLSSLSRLDSKRRTSEDSITDRLMKAQSKNAMKNAERIERTKARLSRIKEELSQEPNDIKPDIKKDIDNDSFAAQSMDYPDEDDPGERRKDDTRKIKRVKLKDEFNPMDTEFMSNFDAENTGQGVDSKGENFEDFEITTEYRYRCKLCNSAYTKEKLLTKHIRKKHENSKVPYENDENKLILKQLNFNDENKPVPVPVPFIQKDITHDMDALPLPPNFEQNEFDMRKPVDNKPIKNELDNVNPEDESKINPINFRCDECGLECPSKRNLKKHLIEMNHTSMIVFETERKRKPPGEDEKKIECKFCDFVTIRKKYIQRHLREKHDVKISFSKIKRKSKEEYALSSEQVKEHVEFIDGNYNCKSCNYAPNINHDMKTKEKYMKRHVRKLHLVKEEPLQEPQTCEICAQQGKTFRTRLLQRHVKRNHSDDLPDLTCDRDGCNYTTKEQGRITRHISEVHEGIQAQVCHQCNKAFKRKATLRYHIQEVHEGIKIARKRYYYPHQPRNHVCHMCTGDKPYASAAPSQLKYHINQVHLKLEDSLCPYCDHRSTREHLMRKHIKFIHEKCRDFECTQCGYLFSSSAKLARHVKTVHEKIKDQICEHCSASFSSGPNLREHVKVIHLQIREYRCDECGMEMTSRSNLKKHLIQLNHSSKLDKIPFDPNSLSMLNESMNGGTETNLPLPPNNFLLPPTNMPLQPTNMLFQPATMPMQPPIAPNITNQTNNNINDGQNTIGKNIFPEQTANNLNQIHLNGNVENNTNHAISPQGGNYTPNQVHINSENVSQNKTSQQNGNYVYPNPTDFYNNQ